jgi:chaperonin cofactor prefoldin
MNKRIIAIIAVFSLLFGMNLTSCSKKPQNLEEYLQKNEDAMERIEALSQKSGLDVSIEGNNVVYKYDISNIEDVTEEIATDDLMIKTLNSSLDGAAEDFKDLCTELEKESSISGIIISVTYTYKDTELVSRQFSSEGVVNDSDTAASDSESAS